MSARWGVGIPTSAEASKRSWLRLGGAQEIAGAPFSDGGSQAEKSRETLADM